MSRVKKTLIVIIALSLLLVLTGCQESNSNSAIGKKNYIVLDDGTIKIVKWDGKGEEINIPEKIDGYTISAIGNEALGYNDVKTVTLPDTITLIEGNPFSSCHELEIINVSPSHGYLAVIDGVLFSKPDKRLIHYPKPLPTRMYSVPDGIKIIGQKAFSASHNLTIVKLPSSVERIENEAFNNCQSLASIDLPEGLKFIGHEAFGGLNYTSFFTIPSTVEFIEGNPFMFNKSLKSIRVAKDNKTFTTVDDVLIDTVNKVLISYPQAKTDFSYDVPDGIETIGSYAFTANDNIHILSVTEGVKTIQNAALFGCTNLGTVILPDSLQSIDSRAFDMLESLKSITIPQNVKSIGNSAFSMCRSLKEVIIKDGVETIGEYAFGGCSGLQRVLIPQSVKLIEEKVFSNCSEDLVVSITNNDYAVQYCKDNNIKYTISGSTDWL